MLTCLLIYVILITLGPKSDNLFPKFVYSFLLHPYLGHHKITLTTIAILKYQKLYVSICLDSPFMVTCFTQGRK